MAQISSTFHSIFWRCVPIHGFTWYASRTSRTGPASFVRYSVHWHSKLRSTVYLAQEMQQNCLRLNHRPGPRWETYSAPQTSAELRQEKEREKPEKKERKWAKQGADEEKEREERMFHFLISTSETTTFLAPRKSFDILALYKSDYYYYYYYNEKSVKINTYFNALMFHLHFAYSFVINVKQWDALECQGYLNSDLYTGISWSSWTLFNVSKYLSN